MLFSKKKTNYQMALEKANKILDRFSKDARYQGAISRARFNLALSKDHRRILKLIRNIKKILDIVLEKEERYARSAQCAIDSKHKEHFRGNTRVVD